MEPGVDDHRKGLKPEAQCPNCGRMSYTGIVICKGVNTPTHKGRRYRVVSLDRQQNRTYKQLTANFAKCLYNTKYSRTSPKVARNRILRSNAAEVDQDDTYRACTKFEWLDEAPRAPEWWVDQNIAGNVIVEGKYVVKCPGMKCAARRAPRNGNRACTNGGCCNECCDEYQRRGLLPRCGYSSHNFKKKIDEVSGQGSFAQTG